MARKEDADEKEDGSNPGAKKRNFLTHSLFKCNCRISLWDLLVDWLWIVFVISCDYEVFKTGPFLSFGTTIWSLYEFQIVTQQATQEDEILSLTQSSPQDWAIIFK